MTEQVELDFEIERTTPERGWWHRETRVYARSSAEESAAVEAD